MSIANIGSFGSVVSVPSANKTQSAAASGNSAVQDFLTYMKEPVAQRMIDAWLKAHGLTEQDLKNMSPQKRDAIEKQMADDIKNQATQKAESKLTNALDIIA